MLVLPDPDQLSHFLIPFPALTCRLFSLAQLLSELVVLLEDPVPVQQGGIDLPPGKKRRYLKTELRIRIQDPVPF